MSRDLLTADDVAREYARRSGRPIKASWVRQLATRGRLPIAGRDARRRALFSERAILALLARDQWQAGTLPD